jgi:hypothetical protein
MPTKKTKKTAPKKVGKKKKIVKKVSKKVEVKEKPKVVEEVVDAPIIKDELPLAILIAKAVDQYVEVEGLMDVVCRLGKDKYRIEIGKNIKVLRAHLPILEGAGKVKKIKI